MRKLILVLLSLTISFAIMSCGGGSPETVIKQGNTTWKIEEDPLKDLVISANKIIDEGGIAAVGEGFSKRADFARQKAHADAEGKLAEIFSTKVDRLKKNFQEEVGQGRESEVNELFSVAQKSFTQKTLIGAVEKDTKILSNDKGEYRIGLLLAITPKTVNMSLMDEMQSGKPQLYQRFRASKAFEDLQKEIDNYDKKENNTYEKKESDNTEKKEEVK
ncbi:MAG: hypothetical protein WCJ01_02955 [Ignavibacteria bacterium]